MIVTSKSPKVEVGGEIAMVITRKAGMPAPTNSVTKDDGDGEQTDSIQPPCPQCTKPDNVLSIALHPDLGGSEDASDPEDGTSPEDAPDDESPDGYCCTTCAYAWPAEKPAEAVKTVPAPVTPAVPIVADTPAK